LQCHQPTPRVGSRTNQKGTLHEPTFTPSDAVDFSFSPTGVKSQNFFPSFLPSSFSSSSFSFSNYFSVRKIFFPGRFICRRVRQVACAQLRQSDILRQHQLQLIPENVNPFHKGSFTKWKKKRWEKQQDSFFNFVSPFLRDGGFIIDNQGCHAINEQNRSRLQQLMDCVVSN
jgi:hypothetical protein